MLNIVQLWLEIIGVPERAEKLLKPWTGDPVVVMFGQRKADALYTMPRYRPALDSWDCLLTQRKDVMIWATWIAEGNYHGPFVVSVTAANDSAGRLKQILPLLDHTVKIAVPLPVP
jgi:hypothetical protein